MKLLEYYMDYDKNNKNKKDIEKNKKEDKE
jgi:hypothetical protein